MPQLYLHNKQIESIFELLGSDENDITYSVGWALYSSPAFLRRFLKETINYEGNLSEVTIRLQDYRRTQGITDIEIRMPGEFHIVVEAKKGWNLPGARQLKKYAVRFCNGGYRTRRILVLSECSLRYADNQLETKEARGIPVQAASWSTVANVAHQAVSHGRHAEKRLVREFLSYLRRVVTVQNIESNWVYIVSLEGRGIVNWTKKRVYFHRVHGGPKEHPNYIAARYNGKLQCIRYVKGSEHVDGHELLRRSLITKLTHQEQGLHVLYRLGPDIRPPNEVRSGPIRDRRVWCMMDTLFTSKTIREAEVVSSRRKKRAERIGG